MGYDDSCKKDNDKHLLEKMNSTMLSAGYNTRMFDPAGQDDIGGGCGQLWYTQEWIKNYKEKR